MNDQFLLMLSHAENTRKILEQRLKHRGATTGWKAWELELLKGAYDALRTPLEERKFSLNKKVDKVQKVFNPVNYDR